VEVTENYRSIHRQSVVGLDFTVWSSSLHIGKVPLAIVSLRFYHLVWLIIQASLQVSWLNSYLCMGYNLANYNTIFSGSLFKHANSYNLDFLAKKLAMYWGIIGQNTVWNHITMWRLQKILVTYIQICEALNTDFVAGCGSNLANYKICSLVQVASLCTAWLTRWCTICLQIMQQI